MLEEKAQVGGAGQDRVPVRQGARAGHLDRRLPAGADAARAAGDAAGRPAAAAPRPALLPAHHRQPLPAVRIGPGGDASSSSCRSSPRPTGGPTRRCRPEIGAAARRRRPDLAARSRCRSRRPPSATCARRCARSFIDLCRGSVGDYLDRFELQERPAEGDVRGDRRPVRACTARWDTPGSGMNFLVHNMCRLPGVGRHLDDRRGRHGHGHPALRRRRPRAPAPPSRPASKVERILHTGGVAEGVAAGRRRARCARGSWWSTPIRSACATLVGPRQPARRLQPRASTATGATAPTFKVNLALQGLPRFTCLPEDRGQYGPTIHLLPDEDEVIASLRHGVRRGAGRAAARLPHHRVVHPHHGRSQPARRRRATTTRRCSCSGCRTSWRQSTWEAEEERYVQHLLSLCDRFAPGHLATWWSTPSPCTRRRSSSTSASPAGHIHHVDNSFGFADRLPYATPLAGPLLVQRRLATRPARSSAPPATTPPSGSSRTWEQIEGG